MKIIVVTHGIRNLWMGGVARYFSSIKPIIESKGNQLYFFDDDNVLASQPSKLKGLRFVTKGIFSNKFAQYFRKIKPDAVHIQSEFGSGVAARNFCLNQEIPFSAAYHTNFEIWLKTNHVPSFWIWPYLRWFYKPARVVYTHTPRLKEMLRNNGIMNPILTFPPGVDTEKFSYQPNAQRLKNYPRPYFVTMSRLAKEKRIEEFLELDLPGTKFVIGEGPERIHLINKYKGKAVFLQYENIADYLSECDVFVLPSRFGTHDLVILEALACGLPVAAYPVTGPLDVIEQGITGFISNDLRKAALNCLSLKKAPCIVI